MTKHNSHLYHIQPIDIDKDRRRNRKAYRRVVEQTLRWLSKCHEFLVRYDEHDFNYPELISLAFALFYYRRVYQLQAAYSYGDSL
jgi:hypothetical protein